MGREFDSCNQQQPLHVMSRPVAQPYGHRGYDHDGCAP